MFSVSDEGATVYAHGHHHHQHHVFISGISYREFLGPKDSFEEQSSQLYASFSMIGCVLRLFPGNSERFGGEGVFVPSIATHPCQVSWRFSSNLSAT